jgi:hypothetical protein
MYLHCKYNPAGPMSRGFLLCAFSDKFSVRAGMARMQLEAASEQILTQAGRPHLRGVKHLGKIMLRFATTRPQ